MEAFDIADLNVNKPIGENLVHIINKTNTENIETNTKLMKWSEKKFFTKVCAKLSSAIALRKVDLSTLIKKEEALLQSIYKLYSQLGDVHPFISGCEHEIMMLQADIKASGTIMQSAQGDT